MVVMLAPAALAFPTSGKASSLEAASIASTDSIVVSGTPDTLDALASKEDSSQARTIQSRSGQYRLDRQQLPGLWDPILNLPRDWRDWWMTSMREENYPWMSLVFSTTVMTILTDHETWVPFKKWYETGGPAVQGVNDAFVFVGDGKFQFGLAVLFAGYGAWTGDQRALRTASQTVEVILACGGVVQLLKHVTGRESPVVSTSPTGVWRFFPNQIDYAKHVPHYDAFPSGHLATALATLTVIANNYPDATWIRPIGYAALVGVATGLVSTSIHWWSDFPLSIALGYGFGCLISPTREELASHTPSEKAKDHSESNSEPTSLLKKAWQSTLVYPTFNDNGAGLGLRMTF